MRRFLVLLPVALGLGGCIESPVDLSASVAPAFPLAEGYYKATSDPTSPAFKIVKNGSDYRAIDPKEANGKGAVFALMDPDNTGVFIAEDKTGAGEAKPSFSYYFVRIAASGDQVDLYDVAKDDWRSLPADLQKRLVPGLALGVAEESDTAALLRDIDRRLASLPTVKKTTFRLVRKLQSGEK
jgi:hypothetical protein